MKKIIAIILAVAMCTFIPLIGADNIQEINVTLDPQGTVLLEINRTAWNPTAKIGENESTATNWAEIKNNGTLSFSKVEARAEVTDPAEPVWSLGATAGNNQFNMTIIREWSGLNVLLTTSDQNLPIIAVGWDSGMPAGTSGLFGLQVYMPTSTSTNEAHNVTINFTATIGEPTSE